MPATKLTFVVAEVPATQHGVGIHAHVGSASHTWQIRVFVCLFFAPTSFNSRSLECCTEEAGEQHLQEWRPRSTGPVYHGCVTGSVDSPPFHHPHNLTLGLSQMRGHQDVKALGAAVLSLLFTTLSPAPRTVPNRD